MSGVLPPGAGPGSVAPADPGEAGRDEDGQPRGYFIGGCGHRAPIPPNGRVGECRACDPCRPAVPDLRLPAGELYSISVMDSADSVSWWWRLCDQEATVASAPAADTAAVEHLAACHGAVVATASVSDGFYDRLATGCISPADGAALIKLLETVQHTAYGPTASAYAELLQAVGPVGKPPGTPAT